jgi:hypothetical protein
VTDTAARAIGRGKTIQWDTGQPLSTIYETLAPSGKLKVLTVEDNEVNGRMVLKLLSIAGYAAELAEDGVVALEMITRPGAKYAVILMDCQVVSRLANS